MKIFEKIIKYLTDILKFSAFIFFERWARFFYDSILFLYDDLEKNISLIFAHNLPGLFDCFYHIFAIYLYTILSFFCAKRLGIIRFLNKFPLWLSSCIIVLICICAFYHPLAWFDNLYENWEFWDFKAWFFLILFGLTFLNVYITYKVVKFLIEKFPKKMGFLKYFYPKFLDKIPDVVVLFLAIILMKNFIPLVIKYEDGTCPEHFYLSSGDYFLYLMIFFFIVKIVFLFYNYYNKHYIMRK